MTRRGLGYAVYFLPRSLVGSVSPIVSAYAINMWGIWFLFPFAISMFIIALTILQLMPVREAYRDRRQKTNNHSQASEVQRFIPLVKFARAHFSKEIISLLP